MQNLTARYNIIFNSNQLLQESITNIELNTPDNYDNILPVFKVPTEDMAQSEKGLDSIIVKANVIIAEKSQSNYVDDAYMLIGKANFYKANFFNAAEFFKYVSKTYHEDKEQREAAWLWEARALINLDNRNEAANRLDSALEHISYAKKRLTADVYATEAQFNIITGNELYAIEMLNKALKAHVSSAKYIRWKFILAQLQEKNNLLKEAYANYTAVIKSNASFELAFNAQLNRIRIEDENGQAGSRLQHLRALLKPDKNLEFKDQIYYRIGDTYLGNAQTDEAITNYNLSIKNSLRNQTQKGLSYYRLAEIYFKNTDYAKAKSYYDSTLTSLPQNYQGYNLILVKSKNLDLLANRYNIISREDTLQALARMPEALRDQRIGELVREQVNKAKSIATAAQQLPPDAFIAAIDNPGNRNISEGKFYFNNVTALSQGFSDFKRRWGDRKLEDNWRFGTKTSLENTVTAANDSDKLSLSGNDPLKTEVNEDTLKKAYKTDIPLTESQVQKSNQKIINAYYDIANFYRDELKDEEDAINTYEELLKRFPENQFKIAVYYNLYRLYSSKDTAKADRYKDLLMKNYPDSPYAKIITDPEYFKKLDAQTNLLTSLYNEIYALYLQKNYAGVLTKTTAVEQAGENAYSTQFSYLKALAIGHTQKLEGLENAFRAIVAQYPDDKFITPLVKQHLEYIDQNRDKMSTRPVALVDFDPNEPRFIEEPAPEPEKKIAVNTPVTQQPPAPAVNNAKNQLAAENKQPQTIVSETEQPERKSLFSLPDSAEYYFVVNVTDAGANLSSSRFGIGQFNRINFPNGQIKHQLKEVNNENQLIFVGSFSSKETVKDYERNIIPLMRNIMKIAPEKYNTFVITNAGLDKLTDRNMINLYLDFYKQQL